MITRIEKTTIIGDAIKACPETKKVIEKHFGNGCFTCPGINMEDIGFGCLMHNLDADSIIRELNEALEKQGA